MTIEEAITHIMDVICENNTIKHSDLVVFDNEKQALRIAAETMHKYQKIQEIYERFQKDGGYYHHMAWLDVMEVVKDGNVD